MATSDIKQKVVSINFRVPIDLRKRVEDLAGKESRSVSGQSRKMILDQLEILEKAACL